MVRWQTFGSGPILTVAYFASRTLKSGVAPHGVLTRRGGASNGRIGPDYQIRLAPNSASFGSAVTTDMPSMIA